MVDPTETIVPADPSVIEGLDYWRTLPIKQQPQWSDPAAVAAASAEIAELLVTGVASPRLTAPATDSSK